MSMGLGPDLAPSTRPTSTATSTCAGSSTPARSRVWCFVGDGEMDEPESIGALGVAGREHLDNLIFVVNCNLQRLDGPVRGNGKIIQELEAVFRGAGWNVIKVIWGSRWDALLAKDVDGVLLDRMNTTVDGEYQKLRRRVGRLHPRALLRPRPPPAQAGRGPERRRAASRCPAAGTTTASSTPPTSWPPSRRARPRSSWPRRSRAGRSGPRSRRATPRTRSRR